MRLWLMASPTPPAHPPGDSCSQEMSDYSEETRQQLIPFVPWTSSQRRVAGSAGETPSTRCSDKRGLYIPWGWRMKIETQQGCMCAQRGKKKPQQLPFNQDFRGEERRGRSEGQSCRWCLIRLTSPPCVNTAVLSVCARGRAFVFVVSLLARLHRVPQVCERDAGALNECQRQSKCGVFKTLDLGPPCLNAGFALVGARLVGGSCCCYTVVVCVWF